MALSDYQKALRKQQRIQQQQQQRYEVPKEVQRNPQTAYEQAAAKAARLNGGIESPYIDFMGRTHKRTDTDFQGAWQQYRQRTKQLMEEARRKNTFWEREVKRNTTWNNSRQAAKDSETQRRAAQGSGQYDQDALVPAGYAGYMSSDFLKDYMSRTREANERARMTKDPYGTAKELQQATLDEMAQYNAEQAALPALELGGYGQVPALGSVDAPQRRAEMQSRADAYAQRIKELESTAEQEGDQAAKARRDSAQAQLDAIDAQAAAEGEAEDPLTAAGRAMARRTLEKRVSDAQTDMVNSTNHYEQDSAAYRTASSNVEDLQAQREETQAKVDTLLSIQQKQERGEALTQEERIAANEYAQRYAGGTAEALEQYQAQLADIDEELGVQQEIMDQYAYTSGVDETIAATRYNLDAAQTELDKRGRFDGLKAETQQRVSAAEYEAMSRYTEGLQYADTADAILDTLNLALSADGSGKQLYTWINDPEYRNAVHIDQYLDKGYDLLTDDEIKEFNVRYHLDGESGAREFLEQMQPVLNERRTEALQAYQYGLGKTLPVLSSAISVVGNVASGMTAPLVKAATAAASALGKPIDPNDHMYDLAKAIPAMRSGTAERVSELLPYTIPGTDQNALAYLYNALMSGVDSTAAYATSLGVAGLMGGSKAVAKGAMQYIMSSEASINTLAERLQEGESVGAALVHGEIDGLIEAATETWSIETLFSDPTNLGRYIAKNFVSEGSEEISGDVLGLVVDEIESALTGKETDIRKEMDGYIANGATEQEAFAKAVSGFVQETLLDGLAGAISGVGIAGVGAAQNSYTTRKVSKSLQKSGVDVETARTAAQELNGMFKPAGGEQAVQSAAEQMQQQADASGETHDPFHAQATVDGHADAKLQITGFSEVSEDGSAKVTIQGEGAEEMTVPLSQMQFQNESEKTAYQNAAKLGDVTAARRYLAGYELSSLPVEVYDRAFRSVFDAGRNSRVITDYEQTQGYASMLSEQVRKLAYDAGKAWTAAQEVRMQLPKEIEGDMRTRLEALPKTYEDGYTGVVYQAKTTRPTAAQAVMLDLLDSYAKKQGVHYTVVDTLGDGSNGVYRSADGMVIALDAQEGYLTRTATHEGWHYIQEHAAEEARILQEYVLDTLRDTEGYDLESRIAEKQAQYKEAMGQELTREAALEELVADALYDVIATPENMADMVRRYPKFIEKIADFINGFIKEVRSMMRRIANRNPEARAMLAQEAKHGEAIIDEYNRLMKKAGEAETKNHAREDTKTGAKHQLRDEAQALVNADGDAVAKTEEEYWTILHNPGWSYRGKAGNSPLSDWGTAMFSDDGEKAYFPDTLNQYIGSPRKGYYVNKSELVDVDSLSDEIWDKWREDWENGTLEDEYGMDYLTEEQALDKEEILSEFNPDDIVDSARAYDNAEFVRWFYDRIIEPKGIAGVNTSDGAVVFDENVIHKIVADENAERHERYSLRDVDQDMTETEQILAENTQLLKLVGSLNAQIKAMSGAQTVNAKDVRNLARELKANYESKISVNDLAYNLQAAFDQMANAKSDTDGKAAMTAMGAIVKDMLEKSQRTDSTMYDEYKDMRDYLRKTPMKLTESQWQEAKNLFGSEQAFRRAVMGKWRIAAKDSIEATLDSYWPEMVQTWPGMFETDTNEGDQISAVLSALDATAKIIENPYEMTMDQMVQDVTAEVYERYLAMPSTANKETETVRELLNRTEQAEQQTAQKQQQLEDKEIELYNYKADNKSLQVQLANARNAAREQTTQWAKNRAAREQQQAMRREIIRQKGRILQKLQNPKAGSFVPYQMHDAVTSLLTALGVEDSTVQKQTTLTADMLRKAKEAYEAVLPKDGVADSGVPALADFYNGDLVETFDALMQTADGKKLNDLNAKETEQLRDIVNGYAAMIINEDRLFTQQKKESLQEMGDGFLTQMNRRREHMIQSKTRRMFSEALSRGLLTPTTVFGQFEGTEMEPVWRALRNAEWTHIRNVQEASAYLEAALEKYHEQEEINKSRKVQLLGKKGKDGKRTGGIVIELDSGNYLRMTREEAMTIYASEIREKLIGTNHLLGGGITFANTEGREGQSAAVYKLTQNDLDKIAGSLTAEQKAYVNHMVAFLSTTAAEWGNKVTREMYGVEKFKEDYYIPFSVDRNFLQSDPAQSQDNRLKLGSFTKAITQKASNALQIVPFTELWASHVEKMSDYNAFVLPIEDMTRLMNYRVDGESIRATMQQRYGMQTAGYVDAFLRRLNGNGRAEHGGSWINRFISSSKGAAVTFNLSVAIQQAGAGPRAMAEISPKYVLPGIAAGFAKVPHLSQAYAEIEEHAPIAVEKGWGYFDTNMSRGLYDRARNTWKSRADSIGGFLAEKGDQFNWVQIWDAVKREVKGETDLQPGTAEYWQRCADRFTEVVDKTQVVDSIFQRSEWATEKGLIKQSMNFLSEPVKQYNMLWRGLHTIAEGKLEKNKLKVRRGVKELARNAGGIAISAVATAALKSIISALRDRDNEKKGEDEDGKAVVIGVRNFGDKYMESLLPNLMDNLTGLLPVFSTMISDAFSSGYGQGSSTLENTILTNAGRAYQYLRKGEYERALYYALQAGSNAVGVGIGNGYRDVRALVLTAADAVNRDTLAGTAWDKSKDFDARVKAATENYVYKREKDENGNYTDSRKAAPALYYDLMLTAYFESGMGKDFQTVVQAALDNGATEQGLMTGFKNKLRDTSDAVTEAAKALHAGDMEGVNRCVAEIVKGGIGTKAAYSMIQAKEKELYPTEKAEEEGKAENVVEGLQEGAKSALTIKDTRLWSEAVEKAKTGDSAVIADLKKMVEQLQKDGMSQKDCATKIWTLYGKEYKAAIWSGDTKTAAALEKAMTGVGVGLTKDVLGEKMLDVSKTALYDALRDGNMTAAKSMKSYLQQQMGAEAYQTALTKWAKSAYRKAVKEGKAETLKKSLLAMGFAESTLAGWVK